MLYCTYAVSQLCVANPTLLIVLQVLVPRPHPPAEAGPFRGDKSHLVYATSQILSILFLIKVSPYQATRADSAKQR